MTVNKVTTGFEDPVLAELTGPGGAFEIVTEAVLGAPLQVYKNRLHSLGELIVAICTEPIPQLDQIAPWIPARPRTRRMKRKPRCCRRTCRTRCWR